MILPKDFSAKIIVLPLQLCSSYQCMREKTKVAPKQTVKQKPASREFVISCVLNAPREVVFRAWTDARLMAEWWGPHGFTNPVSELDARRGGKYRTVMRGPDGSEHPLKGVFLEITAPERLVRTADHSELPEAWHDMVDPKRDKSKKPDLGCVQTMTFEEIGGKTKLTVNNSFESADVCAALMKLGMPIGWGQSLERLEQCVSKIAKTKSRKS